jgi:tetratricopeptide (TPR) repeat protein
LLRGVLLHFLQRYDEAHQVFDEIIQMLVLFSTKYFLKFFLYFSGKKFATKSFLAPNAVLEKALIYLTLKQKQKAHEYLQKSL